MTATEKPSSRRPKSNELHLADGEIAHVSVDVHKANDHVALVSDQRDLVATWVQPASPEALVERLAPIAAQVAGVVYEAGPTGSPLFRRLQDADRQLQRIREMAVRKHRSIQQQVRRPRPDPGGP